MSRAGPGLYNRPPRIISRARPIPANRVSRWVPPPPGNQAHLDFRQAEARLFSGHPEIAGQGQFKAAPETEAVDRRHRNQRAGFNQVEKILDPGGKASGFRRSEPHHFNAVRSADKIFIPRPGQDRRPEIPPAQLMEQGGHFGHQGGVDRITIPGTIDGHPDRFISYLHL